MKTQPTKVLDITSASMRDLRPMKTKKQLTVFPLRFETKSQRETVRKAAQSEGRSMNNYILRTLTERAAADLRRHAEQALDQLA